jgi:hypothetical protein
LSDSAFVFVRCSKVRIDGGGAIIFASTNRVCAIRGNASNWVDRYKSLIDDSSKVQRQTVSLRQPIGGAVFLFIVFFLCVQANTWKAKLIPKTPKLRFFLLL